MMAANSFENYEGYAAPAPRLQDDEIVVDSDHDGAFSQAMDHHHHGYTSAAAAPTLVTGVPVVAGLKYTASPPALSPTAILTLPAAGPVRSSPRTSSSSSSDPLPSTLVRMKMRRKNRQVAATVVGAVTGLLFLGPIGAVVVGGGGYWATKAAGRRRERKFMEHQHQLHVDDQREHAEIPAHKVQLT
jgi:hypothetical protein